MRRVSVILALAVLGAVILVRLHAAREDCPTTMTYDGVSYTVHELSEEIGSGELGIGTERGCGDNGPWTDEVAVSRVAGVDPRTALATPAAAHVLYLASGVTADDLPSDVAELVVS